MSEQLLTLLRFSLLGFLYLFLFRVVRAVWAEITPPPVRDEPAGRRARGAAPAVAAAGAPAVAPAPAPSRGRRSGGGRGGKGRSLVVVSPPERAGSTVELPNEATVGRAPGCQVTLDDTFVSQLHARVFRTDDGVFVEDLGSTNGTFLNDQRVGGPQPVRRGDRIQVGQTVLELR